MAHNIVELQGQQICTKCGRLHFFEQFACYEEHPHDITYLDELICRKCGDTSLWNRVCIEKPHNIVKNQSGGGYICTRCGRINSWRNYSCI